MDPGVSSIANDSPRCGGDQRRPRRGGECIKSSVWLPPWLSRKVGSGFVMVAGTISGFSRPEGEVLRCPSYGSARPQQPGRRFDCGRRLRGGTGAVHGTHTGTLRNPDGAEVPATGKEIDFPFVGVFRVENGKISSIRIYYDQIEVFTQLGLMPGATST